MADPIEQYNLQIINDYQKRPTEWIIHALDHLLQPSDFDKRQAYLLLDGGIESLFKVYLAQQEKNSIFLMTEIDRSEQGQYFKLIEAVGKINPAIYSKFSLGRLKSFHRQRNILYHETRAIKISYEETKEFAQLAIGLLKDLMGVDLGNILIRPDSKQEEIKKEIEPLKIEQEASHKGLEIENIDFGYEVSKQEKLLYDLQRKIEVSAGLIVEKIAPGLITSDFLQVFGHLVSQYRKYSLSYTGDDETDFANESSGKYYKSRASTYLVNYISNSNFDSTHKKGIIFDLTKLLDLDYYRDPIDYLYIVIVDNIVCSGLERTVYLVSDWTTEFLGYQLGGKEPWASMSKQEFDKAVFHEVKLLEKEVQSYYDVLQKWLKEN